MHLEYETFILLFYFDQRAKSGMIQNLILQEKSAMKDREQILEMLAKVKDQISLSIYKKVYNISDDEISEKRKTIGGAE